MSDVVNAGAGTGPVTKRKPVEPDAEGVAQLVAQLVEQARSAGLQLAGEGGLLRQLTKRVLKSALEGEIRRSPGLRARQMAQGRPICPPPCRHVLWGIHISSATARQRAASGDWAAYAAHISRRTDHTLPGS